MVSVVQNIEGDVLTSPQATTAKAVNGIPRVTKRKSNVLEKMWRKS